MEKYLNQFCEKLKELAGNNLISVILYGSFARGENVEGHSDVNLMLVTESLHLNQLTFLEKEIHHLQKKINLNIVFWTKEELESSIDVFPIEFLEISEHHKTLYGEHLLKEISVDTKNFRHQLEFELRSKLLKLRSAWLEGKESKKMLFKTITRAGTSFFHLYNQAKKLSNENFSDELAGPFRKSLQLKKKEIALNQKELQDLYCAIYESAVKMVKLVNCL